MQKKPDLNVEEWNILANRLATEGWLIDSYNPKNGQRRWKATKWGERHYQNERQLEKVLSDLSGIIQGIIPYGKKLTNQEKLDLIYITEIKLEENIADALDNIADLIERYKVERNDFANIGANSQANLLANMIKELEKIQDKLVGQYK